jgi:hypothetical protein
MRDFLSHALLIDELAAARATIARLETELAAARATIARLETELATSTVALRAKEPRDVGGDPR